jgi:hypothetical protein
VGRGFFTAENAKSAKKNKGWIRKELSPGEQTRVPQRAQRTQRR